MLEIKTYKTQDLVLTVTKNYDTSKLDLKKWVTFIDLLCGDREYQKDAIIDSIVYLASGEYESIEGIVQTNWNDNSELRERYKSVDEYLAKLQLPHKLSGVIDLATGTGKSYVMYGIAQIALGIGLVDKVLLLCPSVTIESSLKEKFQILAGDATLKASLPADAVLANPRITDANSTIKDGDIAIENIHAVYERTGSSIKDSLGGKGERVLVLNDEVHHAYNSSSDIDIKKWKSFLLSSDYRFKYVLGFTGTAYSEDDYFNDVIYRYSIRQAVDDRVVKSVDYVSKDESIGYNEKFQKIYDNHDEFKNKYRLIKPLTILVTADINKARGLREELIDFLERHENLPREAVEEKVLIVTSHKDHRKNVLTLRDVDRKDNAVEWIVSVSMLTEGWDVKNVFQIVPWEDRAFNSKLLIAQVLGRGLRVPKEYESVQPKVRVFNHDSWSRNIRGLVNEILEVDIRLSSVGLSGGSRASYHFDLYNMKYEKIEKEIQAKKDTEVFDYSRGYANLVSQVEISEKETEYEGITGGTLFKTTVIRKETTTVDEVVYKIIETFKTRDFEAKIRFPEGTYEKENLPPEAEIRKYVTESMRRVGIKSNVLTNDNANRIYSAFQTLLRSRGSTVVLERIAKGPIKISTKEIEKETIGAGSVRHGATIFYSNLYKEEVAPDQLPILEEIINDESLPRRASKEINNYDFKTPVSLLFTKQEPERLFVECLINSKLKNTLDAWIKSRDQYFYSIEYSWRKGEHTTQATFNPDFFLKVNNKIIVVEIKADDDDSEENKAKYRWSKQHFEALNKELRQSGIDQGYFMHFVSPSSYGEFIEYLSDGRLLNGEFRSNLEIKLMPSDD